MCLRFVFLVAALCCSTPSFATIIDPHSPVIGVSGHNIQSPSVRFIMASLYELGATPVLLDIHHPESIEHTLSRLDGVVLAGNSFDINPANYGAAPAPHTRNETIDKTANARAAYEYHLLDATLKLNVPTLGICGGMQRMNVANFKHDGGTLRQHVEGENQYYLTNTFDPHTPVDFIRITPHTTLASLLKNAPAIIKENSLHHQAIGQVRKGFRVSAVNVAGTIEAIEADPAGIYGNHPFLLGVQWHPEYAASAASHTLLKTFVAKATQHRAQRNTPWVILDDGIDKKLNAILRKGGTFMRNHYGYAMPQ